MKGGSDRPWGRKLAKLAMTLRHGRRMAHAQDWWPGLALERAGDGGGAILWRGREVGRLTPAAALLAEVPTRCTIVGSGPSLAAQDLSRLPDGSALLLNGAILLTDGPVPRPLAVAIEDERFVHRHHAMIAARVPAGAWCLLSVSAVRALAGIVPGFLARRRVVLIDDVAKPYGRPRRTQAELRALGFVVLRGAAAFSRDPGRGVAQCGTVAYSALQFALASGATQIGLAGIDLTPAPRFYETAARRAPSGLGAGRDRILAHFRLAAEEARAGGRTPLCHSPVSPLPSLGYARSEALEVTGAAAG